MANEIRVLKEWFLNRAYDLHIIHHLADNGIAAERHGNEIVPLAGGRLVVDKDEGDTVLLKHVPADNSARPYGSYVDECGEQRTLEPGSELKGGEEFKVGQPVVNSPFGGAVQEQREYPTGGSLPDSASRREEFNEYHAATPNTFGTTAPVLDPETTKKPVDVSPEKPVVAAPVTEEGVHGI